MIIKRMYIYIYIYIITKFIYTCLNERIYGELLRMFGIIILVFSIDITLEDQSLKYAQILQNIMFRSKFDISVII